MQKLSLSRFLSFLTSGESNSLILFTGHIVKTKKIAPFGGFQYRKTVWTFNLETSDK